jgi:hypothetical protein
VTVIAMDTHWTIDQIMNMSPGQFFTFLKFRGKQMKRMEAEQKMNQFKGALGRK